MTDLIHDGEVDDAATEALARREQEAHQPQPDPPPFLFLEPARERLRLSALRLRQAAVTLEHLAVETCPALRDAHLRGADRYLDEARALYGQALAEE